MPDTTGLSVDSIALNTSNELKSKVQYSAKDSIRFDLIHEKVYLYGLAKVRYEDIALDAGYIEIDWSIKQLFAKGIADSLGSMVQLPEFKQKEESFTAVTVTYNFDTRKGRITEVSTKQGDG